MTCYGHIAIRGFFTEHIITELSVASTVINHFHVPRHHAFYSACLSVVSVEDLGLLTSGFSVSVAT